MALSLPKVIVLLAFTLNPPRLMVIEEIALQSPALTMGNVRFCGAPPLTLMLKVRTENTETLERLIDLIRRIEGVTRSETMVVLSTHSERTRVAFDLADAPPRRRRPQRPHKESP